VTTAPTITPLRQLERRLYELAVMIDGRHARDGTLTWPMIHDSVEDCWRLLIAVLDGSARAADAIPPSLARRRTEGELEKVCTVLETLQARVVAIRQGL